MINFYYGLWNEYKDLGTKDPQGLYYLTDVKKMYRGEDDYTQSVRLYTTIQGKPAVPAQGILYFNTDTKIGEVYNGTSWVQVIAPIATSILATSTDTETASAKAVYDALQTIIEYVDDKTDGIATDAALEALTDRMTAAEDEIDTLDAAVDVLNGASSVPGSVAYQIAQIVAGAPASFDTLKEIADWISTHGEDAAAMNTAILQNATDIDALEALVGTTAVATQIANAILALDLSNTYDAKGSASTAETNAKAYADDLDTAMGTRVTATEAALTTLNGADTVTGSVAKALKDAKDYADGLDTAMDTRMDAVEASLTWKTIG